MTMRFLLLLLCLPTSAVLATPRVVTSIAPLQELTAALMQGIAVPETLIAGDASAHHFALRPSHMQMLQRADLVIWIDRRFEAGLQRISEVLPPRTTQLEVLPRLDVKTDDGHIWYSTPLLLQTVDIILAQLLALDPDNGPGYSENARRLSAAIKAWRIDTQSQLENRYPRYVTDHAFSAHLQTDLGYAPITNIHDHHDDHGGLRELQKIEDRLAAQPAKCLLTLEATPSALARQLAQKYQLQIVNLTSDSTATATATIPAIILRLRRLTSALVECS